VVIARKKNKAEKGKCDMVAVLNKKIGLASHV
jgi:hypothetical protein